MWLVSFEVRFAPQLNIAIPLCQRVDVRRRVALTAEKMKTKGRNQQARGRSLPPENLLTRIDSHVGINPSQTSDDLAGRPRFALERAGVIEELI